MIAPSARAALCAIPVLVIACKTVAPDPEYPARIVDADDASRAALRAAVSAELHTDVMLADDALTESGLLIIERNPPRTMDNPAQGRTMEPAVQFRLVRRGAECVLVDTRDDSRQVLDNTTCVAE